MKKQLWTAGFTLVQQVGNYGALAIICLVSYDLYLEGKVTVGDITQYIFYCQTLIFQFLIMSFVIGNVLGVKGVNDALAKI
jgi:ABC-type multidrug transport system fused ATPase/permease subunit